MHLSWRQLEVFRAFAYSQNVSETARLLHISQPAVSQMLRDIEIQVGFALVQRSRGRSKLTPEAMTLLPDVERILAQMLSLRGRAAEIKDANAGSLTIASVPTLFAELLPQILLSFRAEHQKVRLCVSTLSAEDVVKHVRQDTADVGFAFLPIDEINVAVLPLIKMRVICVVPKGHPLATRAALTVSDLNDQLVIVQGAQTPPGFVLRESLAPESAEWRVLETNQSTSALHLVKHGLGVALIHPLTLSLDMMDYVVPIRFEPAVELTLGMIYPRSRTVPRVVVRFEKHARQCAHVFCHTMRMKGLDCEPLI
ncbi:MAG: LysR family transcriptional regulator [Janthinobacterium lividum]